MGSIENGEMEKSAVPTEAPRTEGEAYGAVIVPESEAATLEGLERSFSDTVTVEYDQEGESGVITPEFRSGIGETYRFLMVPIKTP